MAVAEISLSYKTAMSPARFGAAYRLKLETESAATVAAAIDLANGSGAKAHISTVLVDGAPGGSLPAANQKDVMPLRLQFKNDTTPKERFVMVFPYAKDSADPAVLAAALIAGGLEFKGSDGETWYSADTYIEFSRGHYRDITQQDSSSTQNTPS